LNNGKDEVREKRIIASFCCPVDITPQRGVGFVGLLGEFPSGGSRN
jgi:hypothetical protein